MQVWAERATHVYNSTVSGRIRQETTRVKPGVVFHSVELTSRWGLLTLACPLPAAMSMRGNPGLHTCPCQPLWPGTPMKIFHLHVVCITSVSCPLWPAAPLLPLWSSPKKAVDIRKKLLSGLFKIVLE